MKIRRETSRDHDAVYTLIQEAFASAEHSDGNEQDLVQALRASPAFVPELSLVAEENGSLVGHILFTEGRIRCWLWLRFPSAPPPSGGAWGRR